LLVAAVACASVHPIERLRYVARAGDVDPAVLVQESASALGGLGDDPGGLLLSARRLLARHPASGPLWALCARMCVAADPASAGWQFASLLEEDPTPRVLAGALPDDGRITVLGWPDQIGESTRWRGDLQLLVIDAGGEGSSFARRLQAVDVDAIDVEDSGLGAAAARSSVVLLEASAMGDTGFYAVPGSLAAAAVARTFDIPVWVVAGEGRLLPSRLWAALVAHMPEVDAWEAADEHVPIELVDAVVRPSGVLTVEDALEAPDCPNAPELQGEDHS
jgi:hypothetical protein